jgi:GDP-6-deoxy-D-talose 4-dehydrogenase
MSKILITGASGFMGRHLAALLQRTGHEVHALLRNPVSTSIEGVRASHICDLADLSQLSNIVRDIRPDKVVHLAGIAFINHGDIAEIYKINLIGTSNLLEALVHNGSPLSSVLLASSAYVYGNGIGGTVDEATPPAPSNDYAVSKLAMEYVAKLYKDRLPIVMVRPFNTIGVGQDERFLIPKIIDHVRKRAPLIELGNLDVARDFSDVRTVVQLYQRLLDAPTAVGQTFNVCSGKAWTLNDVLTMVREISGHDFEVRVNPAFVRQNEVKILLGSRTKLDATVGAVPEIAMQDTLRWMLEQ